MLKKNKKFILDIIPLTKIPLTGNQSFSYLSEAPLPAGTLVSIPLFRRWVEGVVVGSKNDFQRLGNIELKKIEKVLIENFLTPKQIALARALSNYYFSPLGVMLKNFTPKRAQARGSKTTTSDSKSKLKNIILTKEQQKIIRALSDLKSPFSKFLLFGPAGSGKTEIYIHSILELRQKNKDFQFLILLPEKTLTPQALERYGAYFKPEEIVMFSSNLSAGKFYANWQLVASGAAKIIIGTRMAIFAPFQKLGLIVIDEEQDMSYKQWEMNPRYDARYAAEKMAELYKCQLVRGSATPSIESYFRAKNSDLKLLTLPPLNSKNSKIELVDMRAERWRSARQKTSGFPVISKKLKGEITYALKYGLQTILFINRQGMSSFSVCANCKTVLRCPKCERALVYNKNGYHKCAHCDYSAEVFPKCENCQGLVFKNVGLGTQKVEKEISALFPSARILVADASSSQVKNFHAEIYADFSTKKADILIGTQMITKGWDLPNVALIGIIDADNMLSFPDFNAEEKAFNLIVQVAGRANRPGAKFPGKILLQTFQPQNKLLNWAAEKNYADFFENEITERKFLRFPPFSKIIKLVYQNYDPLKVEKECQAIFEKFKVISDIKVSEPHAPLLPNIRGRVRRQIIIKLDPKKEFPNLEKELKKLITGWIIDVDPVSLL